MSRRAHKQKKNRKVSRLNSKIFRHTAIASAITIAIAPINVAAGNWGKGHWGRNIEVFAMPTTDRTLIGTQLLEPIFQNTDSLTYLDLRAVVDLGDTEEFNIGVGHRRYYGSNWLLGGLISFDTRNSNRDKQHNQMTFGLEALSVNWDVNFNYYLALSDPKLVGVGTSGGGFQGNTFFANGLLEEGLEGFDAEVGALVPFIPYGETRLYIGGYYFDGDVAPDTGFGFSARLEFRPRKDINLEIAVTDDDLFGTEASLQFKYSFGYAKETGVRSLDERMIQFHQRDIDVKDTGPIDNRLMESGAAEFQQVVSANVVHIDNVKGSVAGDGSFENPYDTFATCIGQRCDTNGSLIYVGAGGVSSTVVTYDTTTFTMADNQSLFGRGVELFGFGGDAFPVLTAAGNAIVLGNNNEVAGLEINGAGGHGIFGSNITGFDIHNNRIVDVSRNGIRIETKADSSAVSSTTGTIINNLISGAGRSGIYLYNYADRDGKATQVVSLVGNTIVNAGNSGIYARNSADDAGVRDATVATQTLSLIDNVITNAGDDGIWLRNDVYGAGSATGSSTAIQSVEIVNNTIDLSGDDGIDIHNSAAGSDSYGNHTATQTISLSGNTVGNSGDNGIHLYNHVYGDSYTTRGTATQVVTLSNNEVFNSDRNGIYIENSAPGDDTNYGIWTATQTVSLNNDNIHDNGLVGGYGVKIYQGGNHSGYAGTTATQKVTITGTSITDNGDGGLWIYTEGVGSDGTTIQTVDLSGGGNTISGNGGNAIQAGKENIPTVTQTLKLDGVNNSIIGTIVKP